MCSARMRAEDCSEEITRARALPSIRSVRAGDGESGGEIRKGGEAEKVWEGWTGRWWGGGEDEEAAGL